MKEEDKKYTVQELIDALGRVLNKELEVKHEGCDCFGDWNGAIEVNGEYILIERK